MPSRPCKHTLCPNYCTAPAEYCPEHTGDRPSKAQQRSYYDQHLRNKDSKAFYNSKAWKQTREAVLTANPVCERCNIKFADTVHHFKPLKDCSDDEKTNRRNLAGLCSDCHSKVEAAIRENRG